VTHRDIWYSRFISTILLGLLLSVTFANTAAVADDAAPPTNQKQTLKELLIQKGVITKEDAATLQETVLAKWIDRITFYGDLRVRHESFFYDANGNGTFNGGVDEHRERFRLRMGTDLKMGDVTASIRLDSGTGQQTGTNQTETTLFSQKGIWLDIASLSWQGAHSQWLKLTGGKMANPFFRVYSTDAVWDEDVNPEGFAENLQGSPVEHVSLFLNAGQFELNELAVKSHDPWLLGEQGGISVAPTAGIKATVATAFYEFVNASGRDSNALGGTVQQGNSRFAASCTAVPPLATCRLLNNYRVLDVTALVNVQAGPIPIALMGDYVRNLANTTTTGMKTGKATGNQAYQVGAIIGKAAEAQTFEVAYFYKLLQLDATPADLADSDFGNGGTARRGHIMWAAYNPTKYLQFKTKYFTTKAIPFTPAFTTTSPPAGGIPWGNMGDVNRLQVDVMVRF
jgi:hypothetical protein